MMHITAKKALRSPRRSDLLRAFSRSSLRSSRPYGPGVFNMRRRSQASEATREYYLNICISFISSNALTNPFMSGARIISKRDSNNTMIQNGARIIQKFGGQWCSNILKRSSRLKKRAGEKLKSKDGVATRN